MRKIPGKFLDAYRGQFFSDRWPTLDVLFHISVLRYPDRPCFKMFENGQPKALSYQEAQTRILILAELLKNKGVQPGEGVALTGKNSTEWALAYLAILQNGSVVIPLDAQLKEEDLIKLATRGRAVALFCDDDKLNIAKDLTLKAIISLDSPVQGISILTTSKEYIPTYTPSNRKSSDVAAILFTSGTTGNPKGVVLSHENLVSDCFLAQNNLSISHNDVFYALLPIHHTYTMLAVFLESISVGAEVIFTNKVAVSSVLSDLKQGKVTMFLGVPILFNKILAGIFKNIRQKGLLPWVFIRTLMIISGGIKKLTGLNPGKVIFSSLLTQASLKTLRICISGGGPLAPQVFKNYNQLGLDFIQGYGLTETSPILALNPKEKYKVTSVGKIIPEVEAKIIDPDETGQGELLIRGPMVMQGYFENPEATKEVMTEDGWLHTGDVGRLDKDNYLYLTGRCKSLIVTEGGKNVYPEEIEYAFQLQDEIEQILVKGWLKDPVHKSEGIEALVYPNQDWVKKLKLQPQEVKEKMDKIIAEVNKELLPYQRIDRITLLENPLTMTTSRKIKRDQKYLHNLS